MSSYQFENIQCSKPGACDSYIRKNITWGDNFSGLTTGPLIIYTNTPLSNNDLEALTTLLNNYIDPSVWLSFDHTETIALHSHFTNVGDIDNNVIQTLIFPGTNYDETTTLDCIKTVIEYKCTNVQNFINVTSGNIYLEIFDLTRNTIKCAETINYDSIIDTWRTLAESGSTQGNTQFKSFAFGNLMNTNTNYDCIHNYRGLQDNNMTFRINGLQYIYYNKT